MMRLWAWYAGEQSQITAESGLAINDSLITKPIEASEMAQLVNLYSQGLLSRRTILDELQRGGVLDPDLIIDDEIERIEEDKTMKLKDTAAKTEAEAPPEPEPEPQQVDERNSNANSQQDTPDKARRAAEQAQ
jgi:hypothetical protein